MHTPQQTPSMVIQRTIDENILKAKDSEIAKLKAAILAKNEEASLSKLDLKSKTSALATASKSLKLKDKEITDLQKTFERDLKNAEKFISPSTTALQKQLVITNCIDRFCLSEIFL